jgi:transposase
MELKKRNRKTERNKEIVAYRKAGSSYRQIAEHFGISIIRVRQILEVWGTET